MVAKTSSGWLTGALLINAAARCRGAVVGKPVDAAPPGAFGWVGESGCNVLEAEDVFRKPRDLENDPPGAVEVGEVNLQTAR